MRCPAAPVAVCGSPAAPCSPHASHEPESVRPSAAMQLRDMERGCDILVATPGRLSDLIERARVRASPWVPRESAALATWPQPHLCESYGPDRHAVYVSAWLLRRGAVTVVGAAGGMHASVCRSPG